MSTMSTEAYTPPQQPVTDEVHEYALFSGRPALGTPLMTGLVAGFVLMQVLLVVLPAPSERTVALAGLVCALVSATVASALVRRSIPDRLRITQRAVELARGARALRRVELARLAEVNQLPTPNGQVLVLADNRRVLALAQAQLADPRDYDRISRAIVERISELDPSGTIGPAAVRAGRLQDTIAQQPVRGVWILAGAVGIASMLAFQAREALDGQPFTDELIGAMSGPLLSGGESFRLFSYAFLHASPLHLILALATLLWLGATIEKLLGWERMLLGFAAGVLGGAIGHSTISTPLPGIGSTGGLFGLIGMLAAVVLLARRRIPRTMLPRPSFWIFTALLAFMLPLALVGAATPDVYPLADRLAGPVGGALLGFVFGAALLTGVELPAPDAARQDVRPFAILAGLALAIGLVGGVTHHRRAHPDDVEILTQSWMALPPSDQSAALQNAVAYTLVRNDHATAEAVDVAARLAEVAVAHSNRNPSILDTLAVALYKQGNQADAHTLLEEALKGAGDNADLKRTLEQHLKDIDAGVSLAPDPEPEQQ